jgi:large subunit ribosomal protein L16
MVEWVSKCGSWKVKFTEREIFPLAGMDKKQSGKRWRSLVESNFNKGGNQTLVKESNFKLKKMLQPKRTKYRKVQKVKWKGTLKRAWTSNGMFGIKSVHEDGMFLTSRQIEAAVLLQPVSWKEKDNYGSKYFQTNQLLRSPWGNVWVKVKVQLSRLPLNPEELCLKLRSTLSVSKEALRLAAKSFQKTKRC